MAENYIHILTNFLADLLEQKKITLEEVAAIVKIFEPVCESVHNRSDLVAFLNNFAGRLPQLEELKSQLMDPNYIFKPATE